MRNDTAIDREFDALTSEFYALPIRIVLDVFLHYLERPIPVHDAAQATRERLIDACQAA